jgi:HlyD family secretion protein
VTINSGKKINPLVVGLISLGAVLVGITTMYTVNRSSSAPKTSDVTVEPLPKITKITSIGRIEPRTEVIKISAPLIFNADRVAKLLVEEGQSVRVGETLAILESRDRLEDNLKQAQEQLKVSMAKLNQVKAGAKTGEINAQAATVRRLQAQWEGERASQRANLQRLEAQNLGEISAQKAVILKLQAEFQNAKAEYERYRQLKADGAVSASQYDAKRVIYQTTSEQVKEAQVNLARIERTGQKQIQEAQANLERIERTGQQQVNEANSTLDQVEEVRPVDVQLAQAEVDSALATVRKAQTELNQSYIRAPITGQILKIHARPGEKISDDDGLLDMGETQQMEAVAEIYQSDISQVKVGQRATITGESFAGELKGKVRLIGMQVDKQNVFSNQPGENLDRKVIDVRIELEPQDSEKVKSLTNSQVNIAIDT